MKLDYTTHIQTIRSNEDQAAVIVALDALMAVVRPRLTSFHRANSSWCTWAEISQEARITIWNACRTYRDGPAGPYFNVAIRNSFVDLMKAHGRERNHASLDAVHCEGDGEAYTLAESIGDDDAELGLVADRDAARAITKALRAYLSPQELKVFRRRLSGWTYAEIGRQLELSPKCVDNALERAVRKLRHARQQIGDNDVQSLLRWLKDHPTRGRKSRQLQRTE
jgi:RNA polymerase sigma factor (sigma-70 family)